MNKLFSVRSTFPAIHYYYRPVHKMSTSSSNSNPIETSIRAALTNSLQPVHMEVINESYMHNVPKGSESHFKVLVVSTKFDGVTLIKVWVLSFLIFFSSQLFHLPATPNDKRLCKKRAKR
jgi:stress-induced morphogen